MFSVVIADDEPLIIKGLIKMIDWDKLKARVVGTCRDGEQLIAQIEALFPDIIISDISMPVKNGIDVIQYLKDHNIISKTIFLSAYQEFEYAKQALNCGVVEYLLKPASKEDLENAIIKAERLLQENLSLQYLEEENRNAHSAVKSAAQEERMEKIGNIFREKLPDTACKFACVCFSADKRAGTADGSEFGLMRFAAFRKIEELLRSERRGFLLKREQEYCHVVFYDSRGDFCADVRQMIEKMKTEFHINLTAGIGMAAQNISKGYLSYKTAVFACKLYYFCQNEIICYDEVRKDYNKSFEDYNAAYEELVKAVIHQESCWEKHLEDCLNLIEELHFGNRNVAENRCVTLLMEFLRELNSYYPVEEAEWKKYENFVAGIREIGTWQEVCLKVRCYLKNFVERNLVLGRENETELIKEIKLYIKENYDQDLNLKLLAKQFYMNPYYFSLFFKQKAGMNFKDYVVEVRMKKAMETLLQKPDIKLQELSNMVGYHDTKAFSERFKQYYGKSPKNYKKSGYII